MKLNADKEILSAAQQCSDDYHKEAHDAGIQTNADWKEIAFFIKGADWMKSRMIGKAVNWIKVEGGVKYIDDEIYYHHFDECIENLKKTMEE